MKKVVVLSIIVLFIGVAVAPSINAGITVKSDIIQDVQETIENSVVETSDSEDDCDCDFDLYSNPDLFNELSDLKTGYKEINKQFKTNVMPIGEPFICKILRAQVRFLLSQIFVVIFFISLYLEAEDGSWLERLLEPYYDGWLDMLDDLEGKLMEIWLYGEELGCWSFPP